MSSHDEGRVFRGELPLLLCGLSRQACAQVQLAYVPVTGLVLKNSPHSSTGVKKAHISHLVKITRSRLSDIMRAVVVKKPGPPEVLELVNDWPVPGLRDGEVTISVLLVFILFFIDPIFINMRTVNQELW